MTTTELPRPAAGDPVTRRSHLRQLDGYRLMTFLLVIFVHVLGATTFPQDIPSDALETLLHLTREAFFALTAFVLMYGHRDRPLRTGTFWRKRVPLVAVPYVVWSVIYWGYSMVTAGQPVGSMTGQLRALVIEIADGTAWYHLYFLLVTLQVYLLFPLLIKLAAVIRRHPWLVLSASGALQLAVTTVMSYPPDGVEYSTVSRFFTTLLPYQFYSVLGAVAAVHFETVHAWLVGHARTVVAAVVATLVVAEVGYFLSVHNGEWPELASDAYRPYVIPWCIAAIAGLYLAGTRWAASGRGSRVMSWAVDRSFAIFLAHPLALALLAPLIAYVGDGAGAPWTTVVVFPATLVLTLLIVEVLRRLPWSKALTGRAPLGLKRADATVTA